MSVVLQKADGEDLRDLLIMTSGFWSEIAGFAGLNKFAPDSQKIEDELREFLDMPDYAVFMARSQRGHPLGFITVFTMPVQLREEPYGIIDKLFVRPEFRRKQIGHLLMEKAKFFARSMKCKYLQLTMSSYFRMNDALAFLVVEKFFETGGSKHKIQL